MAIPQHEEGHANVEGGRQIPPRRRGLSLLDVFAFLAGAMCMVAVTSPQWNIPYTSEMWMTVLFIGFYYIVVDGGDDDMRLNGVEEDEEEIIRPGAQNRPLRPRPQPPQIAPPLSPRAVIGLSASITFFIFSVALLPDISLLWGLSLFICILSSCAALQLR